MDRPLGTHQMLKQITTPEKPSQKKSQRSSTPGKPNSIEKPRFMKEQWDQPEAWGRNGEEGSSSKEISRLSQCSLIYPRTSGENKKKKKSQVQLKILFLKDQFHLILTELLTRY